MATVLLDLEDFQVEIDEEGDIKVLNKHTEHVYGYIYNDELYKIYDELQEMKKYGG